MKNKILNVILIGYIIVLIWLLLVPNVFRENKHGIVMYFHISIL